MEMYESMQKMLRKSLQVGSDQALPKSTSVGMGFMGRIDEESPSDFEEAGVNKGKAYPRSRSYAVANRSAGF
uniref:Uncharacterized protein n=1 Tax=Rhizophora mucronata TaxID=61149 RepID=A0A2P2PKC7_RHIMU